MEIEVDGPDVYGCDSYKELFKGIMSESGKAVSLERACLYLDPQTPLFVFSVILRNDPESRTIADAVSIRTEGKDVHITITDENYAPEVLSALWKLYGRARVDQQTRFDIKIENADEEDIEGVEIASGEDAKQEIIGALWRVIPEGIKARHNISEGRIITIAAAEEIVTPEIKAKAMEIHNKVRSGADV
jgi:putative methanogenesis marker protein 17